MAETGEDIEVPMTPDSSQAKGVFISKRTDPFGHRQGTTLLWRNVSMETKEAKVENNKSILKSVWGSVKDGRVTAIMGPSGAGKTSLLNVLCGRVRSSSSKLTWTGEVRRDNSLINPMDQSIRRNIAFCAQEESLQVTATPREAIFFSARMRLPADMTSEELEQLTDNMLKELGLSECADTIIGGELIKGISGGERKRTAVGVELVVQPTMVFLDEATTGLDSYSALQLVTVLKRVAAAGAAVCLTIHQPASEIFNLLDDLVLLRRGLVMFEGLVSDVPAVFAAADKPLPPNYNPADWILAVAQTMETDTPKSALFPADSRDLPKPDSKSTMAASRQDNKAVGVSVVGQIIALLQREFLNLARFPDALAMRWGGDTFLALLISLIYQGVGNEDRSEQSVIRSVYGALVMAQLMGLFGCAEPSLLYFPQDRPVFLREYATNHYSVVAYFASRTFIEAFTAAVQILMQSLFYVFVIELKMPFGTFFSINYLLSMAGTGIAVFLGCIVEDPRTASELLPIVLIPQLLFAGFLVSIDLIPSWLQWAQYLCAMTYSIRLGVIGEFGDCGDDPEAQARCAEVIERNDVNPDDESWYWGVLIALFVVFRVAAVIALAYKANKV